MQNKNKYSFKIIIDQYSDYALDFVIDIKPVVAMLKGKLIINSKVRSLSRY